MNIIGGVQDSGSLFIPEVGTRVEVFFKYNDPYFGFYKGQRYNKNKTGTFDKNYPMTYGFEDSNGNTWLVDKKEGTVQFEHHSGATLLFSDNGKITIDTKLNDVQINGQNLVIGNNPVPQPSGLCSLPFCLFTGAKHTTNTMLAL
jgi:hypothetical protein